MVSVRPFRALRPTPEWADRVASPPYDVVSSAEAAELIGRHPDSFMKVLRPEAAPDVQANAEAGAEARRQLDAMREQGCFEQESAPVFYLYEISKGSHRQVGIVARCAVAEYESNTIKKHEHVRPAKVKDRTEQFLALGIQTGPIFLSYEITPALETILVKQAARPALLEHTNDEGVLHRIVRIDDESVIAAVEAAFGEVPALYIADGHHRTASSCAVWESAPEATRRDEDAPWRGFMAVLFPEHHLEILPYNRLVKSLGEGGAEGFLAQLRERLPVTESAEGAPARKGLARMYLAGRWYELDLSVCYGESPEQQLDAYALQAGVFGPLLGIEDPRTDDRLDFVGGHRGPAHLAGSVEAGDAEAAFVLYPVVMKDILRVSDADKVMPPKSTWFEPKLCSGLVLYDFGLER